MAPTLRDGDLVFTRSLKKGGTAAVGDIVVLRAGGNFIVKRVSDSDHDSIVLASDSGKETSIFCHRSLSKNRIVGKVIAHI